MPEAPEKELQSGPPLATQLPPVQSEWAAQLLPGYAELHCISNFSFQRGASHPEELVQRAYKIGYEALAITDECSVAGVVRAHVGLKDYLQELEKREQEKPEEGPLRHPFKLLLGSEFAFPEGKLVAIARDLAGWGGLCQFISAARMGDSVKGQYQVGWAHSELTLLQGCEIVWLPQRSEGASLQIDAACVLVERMQAIFSRHLWIGVELLHELDDELWLAALQELSQRSGVPLVAAGDVHMHVRSRKRLQDVITAVQQGSTVAECGFALQGNAERHLRARLRLGQIYPPALLAATLEVARRCNFSLEEIRYNYPLETVPPGRSPMGALARLTLRGGYRRYGGRIPDQHRQQIRHELRLIALKKYEMYFLTVEDIVRFARGRGILCQGRGSAANSTVCYCLHITEVPPEMTSLLFERFISIERNEPPDIDVDFEHQRREEVIQYIYGKYGRERAAIAAVVVRYRSRMAIRDVGKALGVNEKLVDAFAKDHFWFDREILTRRLLEVAAAIGVQEQPWKIDCWMELAYELRGFPRHLSQHVGGFVLTQTRLTRLVPVENAAMADRSIIQWEKDDLEAVGLMKVDVLALGMLSALRRTLELRNQWRGSAWSLAEVPKEDAATYDMICAADTVGVFQIESRAQMSMLPRLKPRKFYDLVVEVAIVRPGPIQGGMVHPYLKARQRQREGLPIHYVKDELEPALGRTLGVPIFQEQVMQLAMVAARFTAGQADALRRSMAAWSRKGGVHRFRDPLVKGMTDNGYPLEFAEGIFKQIEGFGEYGFPESHAASFALLAYSSSWMKCHEPGCFLAAMLNSQPMGFYTPSQLIQDARRHGIEVRPVDVALSAVDCTLEAPDGGGAPGQDNGLQPCVRLGLRLVGTLSDKGAERIVQARQQAAFGTVEDLALRAELDLKDMNALAAADALSSLAGHRRQQAWAASAQRRAPALLKDAPIEEERLHLEHAGEGEDIVFDYAATGLTLRRHPLAVLRPRLERMRLLTASQLRPLAHGDPARACGIVTVRQRPPTAKGTVFVTLEDETGTVNVIVWNHVVEAQRDALLKSRLLAVEGVWQRDVESGGQVRHLLARKLKDLTPLLGRLAQQGTGSRDFH
ncbi:error-prone DNA polymerase [Caenimonas terrae]|uniref:Error-prone DNA polymerase n=1 Tax=Caenimonas terrae TaxID=696074 RepID=A0ABW0NEY1_9BURK